jgi:hypothetical protein
VTPGAAPRSSVPGRRCHQRGLLDRGRVEPGKRTRSTHHRRRSAVPRHQPRDRLSSLFESSGMALGSKSKRYPYWLRVGCVEDRSAPSVDADLARGYGRQVSSPTERPRVQCVRRRV